MLQEMQVGRIGAGLENEMPQLATVVQSKLFFMLIMEIVDIYLQ